PVPAASLTKVGTGTLVFPNSNTYSGKTFINAGVLNIRSNTSLGDSLAPETQTVTVLGSSGTFTLNFRGQNTVALDILDPNLGADMQNALDALSSIGGVGGFVTVTQGTAPSTNVYTIVFGGTLAIGNLPPLISNPSPGVTARPATVQDGPEGTVVASGATLQLQGNRNMTTEDLTLNGPGFANAGALEQIAGGSSTWALP